MTPALHKIWCDEDEHIRYEHFADFNEWLDSEEGQAARIDYGVDALPQPSKALFAGNSCLLVPGRYADIRWSGTMRLGGGQLIRDFAEADYGRGFSVKNLRHMLQFAKAIPSEKIVSAVRRQLSSISLACRIAS